MYSLNNKQGINSGLEEEIEHGVEHVTTKRGLELTTNMAVSIRLVIAATRQIIYL